jgi:glycosyltransferase involved in cell wall biosynthesis
MPKVSVLMSFYQESLETVQKSVDSILSQEHIDFELLLGDDSGNDNLTRRYYQKHSDKRLKLIVNHDNMGLTKTLNALAREAKGEYLARLDADDIAHKKRLFKQASFLDAHPDYVLCGSRSVELLQDNQPKAQSVAFVTGDQQLRNNLSIFNPFIHSTLMIRRSSFDSVGGYDEKVLYAQDYDLTYRLSKLGKIENLDDVLVTRSMHENRISVKKERLQLWSALKTRIKAANHYGMTLVVFLKLLKSAIVLCLPGKLLRSLRRIKNECCNQS